ncbi:hypothetical protein [Desulfovibrio litoralis]|uniref:Uncharacterized protein n=1 Tax=Desulfovibrio litoralis DSM 11393 TaxID=1121455 RepID=A0A1M7TPF2_9BACT|nr:hypothetical protein [Desulfovibrio litoralis]SHN72595.1 hypothetical protein SAMN02745728_02326 [Desulfovibrio litoralis DSM 11393]
MEDILKSIIVKYNLGDTKVFCAPNIPEKKLFNAISTYAPGLSSEEVVLLLDDTVWGGSREGVLLSKDKLFCHELLTDPAKISISDIQNIYSQKSDIYINNQKFISCTLLDKMYSEAFCSFLFELIRVLRGESVTEQFLIEEQPTTATESDQDTARQANEPTNNELLIVSPPQIDADIKEIFNKYSFGNEKLFFFPNIPKEKLLNATKTYATRISSNDVLILLDDTLMGGAKEGMVLTRDSVFFHELLTDPVVFKMKDIDSVFAKDKSLYINKKQVFHAAYFAKEYLIALGNMISDIAELSLTEEERTEKALVKELGSRHEYYFKCLMNILPKRSKLDYISNSLDVFIDQIFAISVQQNNDAWARDAKMENELRKGFDTAAYSLLRLAFILSKRISDKLEKNKVCTYIAMSDCIIHEILIGFLFRGACLIHEFFANHSDKDILAALYAKLIVQDILVPFYLFKISNDKTLNSLQKLSLQSDIEKQVACVILEKRRFLNRICDNLDKLSFIVAGNIREHLLQKNAVFDIRSAIKKDESRCQYSNENSMLYLYCTGISSCINDEMTSYIKEADEKLATIIENFLRS